MPLPEREWRPVVVLAVRRLRPLKGLRTLFVAASHPLLDTMTFGGGHGCALLWPFSDAGFWSPVRLIPVAPFGLRLLSGRGLTVMGTELLLFAPFFLFAHIPRKRIPTAS